MSTVVPLLTRAQRASLPERAREVIEYRKSGLSLNHIQGCPLDCAYCIRHTYGLWDQRQPRGLMSDAEAVTQLASHRYFQAHVTPLQLFNRATDPFLPVVRPHTFAVLEDLDERGLRNHVLVITRPVRSKDLAERAGGGSACAEPGNAGRSLTKSWQQGSEFLQAAQIVAGQQQVDVRGRDHHPERAGPEAGVVALVGVQPHQPVAQPG
jgi:hypothetical protein